MLRRTVELWIPSALRQKSDTYRSLQPTLRWLNVYLSDTLLPTSVSPQKP